MADADWANYKQLRGKTLPERIAFRGADYRLETLFKRDFYAATGLFRLEHVQSLGEQIDSGTQSPPTLPSPRKAGGRERTRSAFYPPPGFAGGGQGGGDLAQLPECVVLKIYHTEPFGIIPLGWLGRMLCDREVHFYQATDGIPGLARFLERHGESGYVREYVPGCHLRDYRKTNRIDDLFYPRLDAMLAAVHARGISHNDLSKAENILVRPDGSPTLIDFQIATTFTFQFPLLRYLGRNLLPYMQSVDRYHIGKHHRKDRPQDYSEAELQKTRRKGILLQLHGWLLRRPYRLVRHFVMNRFMRVTANNAAAGTESSRSTNQLPPARAA